MIDERKIKKELKELVSNAPEGSFEKTIYGVFLQYINKQPIITLEQIKFELRIRAYVAAVRKYRFRGEQV